MGTRTGTMSLAMAACIAATAALTLLIRRMRTAAAESRLFVPVSTALKRIKQHRPFDEDVIARLRFVQSASNCRVPMAIRRRYDSWFEAMVLARPAHKKIFSFEAFVYARTLGLQLNDVNPSSFGSHVGPEATADLLACLAAAGLLRKADGAPPTWWWHDPRASLAQWLHEALEAYDARLAVRNAAIAGDGPTLSRLFEVHKVPVDEALPAPRPCGETSLELASQHGHVAAAAMLIARGASVTAAAGTFDGVTALHGAATAPCVSAESAALLLHHRADVHAKTARGLTPLHSAASSGRLAAVKLLVVHGACIDAEDADGRTPLAHAQYVVGTMGLACPCMEEPLQPLHLRASLESRWGAVAAYLTRLEAATGAAAKQETAQRAWELQATSALQAACEQHTYSAADEPSALSGGGVLSELELLLEACGFAEWVNARDHDGSTALHTAALCGHTASLALLLAHGAVRTPWVSDPLAFAQSACPLLLT